MIDMTAADEISSDARARSNVVRLAAAQALTGANSAVIFATGSIVGASLAPSVSLATVPISMYVAGLAAGTLPTGAISRAYGRRVAFIVGTGCGMLTGLLGAFAIIHASFSLFCCATFLGGLYGAVSQSYRFAAADGASAEYRPKAVSWVMAGGVFAGVLGPQLVQWTMDVWPPYLFAFSFVMQAMVALVAMAVLAGVDAPRPAPSDLHGGRPLLEIVRQPRFIAAALCGIIAYPMMNLVMTSAPLAMKICGSASVIRISASSGISWRCTGRAFLPAPSSRASARRGSSVSVCCSRLALLRSDCPASRRCISGPRCSSSASAGISVSSARPRWCWRPTGRRSATRFRHSTIFWCSG
jgi:MFS family permease